ncbi:DUF4861 family protein [Solitalea koreensis]|uniref:DUF4861 domain-containing protein n=1 Tax=Solitalea koreensis TaxID=543615 RepID=A0A521BQ29_9SPHI|nr:DUF4861 family protein [Solitalea koreensis]SMO48660.1 protein of unknown function [Solitalea koreensis]
MKKIYQNLLLLPFLLFSLSGIAQSSKGTEIKISNKSNLPFEETVVEIPWKQVLQSWSNIDTANFKVIDVKTQKEINFQLEHRGEKEIKNLLVQLSIPSQAAVTIALKLGKPDPFAVKTYCRYVPERKDDFAWENDRIAFRAYGKALEGTKDDAYGLDIWAKRTDRMILNERYKRGDYHVDHGDGLDYYHVGFSLGAGTMSPFVNDTIWFSKNYHRYEILDNGPLRSTFRLYYDEWKAGGIPVKATKTISLDAGSQLNRIDVQYDFPGTNLPVTIGITKRTEPGVISLNEQKGIMAYWEPTHGVDGTTGVGCIMPNSVKEMKVYKQHLLSITEVIPNQIYTYFQGAAWDKAGKVTNESEWFKYLNQFENKLKYPLQVNFTEAKPVRTLTTINR